MLLQSSYVNIGEDPRQSQASSKCFYAFYADQPVASSYNSENHRESERKANESDVVFDYRPPRTDEVDEDDRSSERSRDSHGQLDLGQLEAPAYRGSTVNKRYLLTLLDSNLSSTPS